MGGSDSSIYWVTAGVRRFWARLLGGWDRGNASEIEVINMHWGQVYLQLGGGDTRAVLIGLGATTPHPTTSPATRGRPHSPLCHWLRTTTSPPVYPVHKIHYIMHANTELGRNCAADRASGRAIRTAGNVGMDCGWWERDQRGAAGSVYLPTKSQGPGLKKKIVLR